MHKKGADEYHQAGAKAEPETITETGFGCKNRAGSQNPGAPQTCSAKHISIFEVQIGKIA